MSNITAEPAAKKKGIDAWFKEAVRKFIVSLKRRPQNIPFVAMVIAFLYYSLNLTQISNTTAKIQGIGMGLAGFATMLFSILGFVCFLNAFPTRKKPHIPMLIVLFAMFAIIIFADNFYSQAIYTALTRPDNPIKIAKATIYIAYAYNVVNTHIALVIVTIALIVLLPLYSKLIRKIKTSVEVEDNGSMEAIDTSGED